MSATPAALSGVRAATAKKMQESLRATAQLSFHAECRADDMVLARASWKAAGQDVGYDDLLLHALARVLTRFPNFNALESASGLQLMPGVSVNYAIAVRGQLLAPVLREIEGRSVADIAAARRSLVDKARAGQLKVADMTGGSMTLSSLGQTRVRHFTPILNYPQQAILGVGRLERRPWVEADSGQVVAAQVLGLSLTVDHRWIDGQPAATFLTALCESIETGLPRPG